MATRRTALITIAAGSAAAALGEIPQEHTGHDSPVANVEKVQRTPVFFKGRDYETLACLTDLILPRTDTPGASEVGVPWRIDRAVSQKPELQPIYRDGLAHLNSAAAQHGKPDFLSLDNDGRVSVLTALSETSEPQQSEFFKSLKALTIEWYYNSEPGLAQELGFKGNTYRTEFPGCTHPEHWPAQAVQTKAAQRG